MNNVFEKEYWEEKFRQRGDKLLEPEPFLVDNMGRLKAGTVLDFACGDGRNAVFLAKRGFAVTGADFSREGLDRFLYFSKMNKVKLQAMELDLRDAEKVKGLGMYDNIIISHYKPKKLVFQVLPDMLKNGGVILLCAFNYRQAIERGYPRKFCLEENELLDKSSNLALIKHEVFEDARAYLDGYIFEKI